MTDPKSLFKGEEHAAFYKKYRTDMGNPTVHAIIDFLGKKFNPSECRAVDVGCGSGQGTLPLAPFLGHIVGIDPSEDQIKEINAETKLPGNVEFRVGEAETLPFKDSSVHLITVKAALHWFDIPAFFKEVDRVLLPGGVLAITSGTGFGTIAGHEEKADEVFTSLAEDYRTPEWKARTSIVFSKYKDITFPYEECVRDETFVSEYSVTIRGLINQARTRSDVAKFIKENPEEAEQVLKQTEEKLMKIVGATGCPDDTTVTRRDPQILILCRKPPISAT